MDFGPLCRFLYFCGQLVVAVIMIDGSKTRKSLVWVEVQSPHATERRTKDKESDTLKRNLCSTLNLNFSKFCQTVELTCIPLVGIEPINYAFPVPWLTSWHMKPHITPDKF